MENSKRDCFLEMLSEFIEKTYKKHNSYTYTAGYLQGMCIGMFDKLDDPAKEAEIMLIENALKVLNE